VQLFRFDEEVSVPVAHGGSKFRLNRLIGPGSAVAVQVVYLPVNGLIAPHVTRSQQLLAVVAGRGWVSGKDGGRRDVKAGVAAFWEAGEDHAAGSESGLTAISIEGAFKVRAVSVTVDIVVTDYDQQWPTWFETVRRRVWPAVSDIALRIDHVGSTSVPGMAAKPIIDMDIVVRSEDQVRSVIDRLASSGYEWRGDLGVPGREAFEPIRDQGMPPHQLYLVVENSKAHLDHWLLRDLLRQDADAREQYAALKRRNVELANSDMDVYVAAKAPFVAELLARARARPGLPGETS
jgi:GrpB-like predicted nucleotidyltransferase (UPF0157 family)/quercetin dioxygenase-like cupin family protein